MSTVPSPSLSNILKVSVRSMSIATIASYTCLMASFTKEEYPADSLFTTHLFRNLVTSICPSWTTPHSSKASFHGLSLSICASIICTKSSIGIFCPREFRMMYDQSWGFFSIMEMIMRAKVFFLASNSGCLQTVSLLRRRCLVPVHRVSLCNDARHFVQRRCEMLEHLVAWKVCGRQDNHRAKVPSIATVVAGAEDSYAAVVVLFLEATPIFWHLMASDQKPQPILAAEFGRHIGAILYSHATVRLVFPLVFGGIAPKQVREKLFLHVAGHGMWRGVVLERQRVDVVDCQVLHPRQPTMHNEDLLVDDRCQRHDFEGTDEVPVHGQAVFFHHLIFEASTVVRVQCVHVLVLVVATMHND
mmetsp:Transcript_10431/g.22512  ORF Transcript_10431/g.22512 Transcript_10431/m.22512 type:complete len:359 (-) Transcript_10431:883-1959(-)